jgi:C-terminal processing protease CtpA/Prc
MANRRFPPRSSLGSAISEATRRLVESAGQDHDAVLTACVKAFARTTDPEVKWRLRTVMEKVVDQYLFRVPRGYLGIGLNGVVIGQGGKVIINGAVMTPGAVWVSQVIDAGPAQKAGVQQNDIIVALDGVPCAKGNEAFIDSIQSRHPGDRVRLTLVRGPATNNMDAVLDELPEPLRAKAYTEQRSRAFFDRWFREHLGQTAK